MHSKFELKKTYKVKFFNIFRNFFLLSIFENWLVNVVIRKNNDHFLRKLIPPNYLYPNSSMRKVTRNGIKYELDVSNVNDHLIFYNYSDLHLNNVKKYLVSNTTIIDIGANIGQSTLFFNQHSQGAEIVGFEPHPSTYERALKNIGLNGLDNIKVENLGLGDKEERIKLYEVNPSNIGMNRALPTNENIADYNYVEIVVTTLDKYVNKHTLENISLIKIDVEGFEHKALKGAQETILRDTPTILLELDDENLVECNSSARMLIDFLSSFGYVFYNATTLTELKSTDNLIGCHIDVICLMTNDSQDGKA